MRSKVAILLVVVLLLVSGAPVQQYVVRQREAAHLREGLEALAPDEVFTTLCLAGFRGVAVDYLWMKVLNLQLHSKWHEVRALTELIARLQPNFPTVWVYYNGWNLAYNISVEWAAPEDQWKWVEDGLAYLDEGLRRNPNSIQIIFEKGWIFWHKINLGTAEDRGYFRRRWQEDKALNPDGRTAYEEAAYWFHLAQIIARTDDSEHQHPFISKSQVEAMYYRALYAQAKEELEAGDVDGATKLLNEVRGELERLRARNGVDFAFFDGFDLDYRDVVQTLYRIKVFRETARGS